LRGAGGRIRRIRHCQIRRIRPPAPVFATPGGWHFSIDGIVAPQFQLDDRAVTTRWITDGDSGAREIVAVDAATADRLVVSDGKRAVLALRLARDPPTAAPYND
jgi:hypothetical protein